MILPVGLDAVPLRRVPWGTLCLSLACIAVFAFGRDQPEDQAAAYARAKVFGYWRAHPYLAPAEGMARRVPGIEAPAPRRGRPPATAPADAAARAAEQAELQRRWDAWREAEDQTFERRWSLVPARGLLQPGLLTSTFLHGDGGHLAGNLFFFLVTGAFLLEEVWGTWLIVAVYLLGGVVACLPDLLLQPDSLRTGLGASGAISATLGAVAVRLAHRRIHVLFWGFFLFRTSWLVPVWAYALFVFGGDLVNAVRLGPDAHVAYTAHLAGFACGALLALALRRTGLERRLAPADVAPPTSSHGVDRADDALAAGDPDTARSELLEVLEAAPGHAEALLRLARVEAAHDPRAATDAALRHFALRLEAGDLAGARGLLVELEGSLEPGQAPPALAYRIAEALEPVAPELAARFEAVALADDGLVGVKARVRCAERLQHGMPLVARARAAQVVAHPAAPAALRARAEALLRAPAAPVRDGGAAAPASAAPPPAPARPATRFAPPSVPEEALELDLVGWTGGEGVRLDGQPGQDPALDAAPPEPPPAAPAPTRTDGVEHLGARCASHAGAPAGWRCLHCERLLCARCAATKEVARQRLEACVHCAGAIEPLLVHRRLLRPFGARLLEPLRAPLLRRNRAACLGAAGALTLVNASLAPAGDAGPEAFLAVPLSVALVFALLFSAIHASARGDHQLEILGLHDWWRDAAVPAVRGLAATGFLWLTWAILPGPLSDPRRHGDLAVELDLVTFGWLLGAWLYSPAALLLAGAGATLSQVLAPDQVVRSALRLGRDYLVAASAVGLLVAGEWVVWQVAWLVIRTEIPLLARFLGVVLMLYLPLVGAHLLGLLLHVRGDAVGLEAADGYLEPVLPGVAPLGQWPAPARV